MTNTLVKTHTDGIWISEFRERSIVHILNQQLVQSGFVPTVQNANNFGYPYVYRGAYCRLVDSVFLNSPDAWADESSMVITDNYPLRPIAGKLVSVLPEFWSIWRFEPQYQPRPSQHGFNCFMNRARGDRSQVYYELIKRNILDQGLVSFNYTVDEYQEQYQSANLDRYAQEHDQGQVPYNTVEARGTLEQCIIDSNVSLILETYIANDHIVFSEKIFRALQLPRPWLLYCSPGSVKLLTSHGFDVLADYVDTGYDQITSHQDRLLAILDQLETFIDRKYTDQDYTRFELAAKHNQTLLDKFASQWPDRFANILKEIPQL
jgi:hypothetical protein